MNSSDTNTLSAASYCLSIQHSKARPLFGYLMRPIVKMQDVHLICV